MPLLYTQHKEYISVCQAHTDEVCVTPSNILSNLMVRCQFQLSVYYDFKFHFNIQLETVQIYGTFSYLFLF